MASYFKNSRLLAIGFVCFGCTLLGVSKSVRLSLINYDNSRDEGLPQMVVQDSNNNKRNQTTIPLCTRDQIRVGHWQALHLSQPPFIPEANIGKKHNLQCASTKDYVQNETKGWDTWEWKPAARCKLTAFQQPLFCQLLHNQTILLMGDSLTQEHYWHLSYLLGLRVRATDQHGGYFNEYACNGNVKVVHRRSDPLSPSKLREELQRHNPSLVVLNRGAHYVNDTTLLEVYVQEYIADLREWQQNCTRCSLIWRTSVPGHGSCQRSKQPVTNLMHVERDLATTPQGRAGSPFHWGDFQHQNQLVTQALSESDLDYRVLDAYEINMLRPDEHRSGNDCLHSCLGSKQHVYTQILLHYLLVDDDMARRRQRQ